MCKDDKKRFFFIAIEENPFLGPSNRLGGGLVVARVQILIFPSAPPKKRKNRKSDYSIINFKYLVDFTDFHLESSSAYFAELLMTELYKEMHAQN